MTSPHPHSPTLLKPAKPVGIIGYGAYVRQVYKSDSHLKGDCHFAHGTR